MMGYPYGGMMDGGGWFGFGLMFFFGALVLTGIVVLVILLIRGASSHPTAGGSQQPKVHPGRDEALEIVRRRLAAGEITKEQYDELVRTLGG